MVFLNLLNNSVIMEIILDVKAVLFKNNITVFHLLINHQLVIQTPKLLNVEMEYTNLKNLNNVMMEILKMEMVVIIYVRLKEIGYVQLMLNVIILKILLLNKF